MFYPEKLVHI